MFAPPQEIEPQQPLYFLAEFKRKSRDGLVLWWGPHAAGYTPDLRQAGYYTKEEAQKHESKTTVAVPVKWVYDNCRVRWSVDIGDNHSVPQVFWHADVLRQAVGSNGQG